MPRRLFFAPTGPAPVTIVGSAKATTPPTETTPNAGNTVVVPVPSGVVEGDLLLASVQDSQFANSGTLPPSGWAFLSGVAQFVFVRTAGASEPSSHTWTFNQSDRPRSGCMIAIRNGSIGDYADGDDPLFNFDLTTLTAVSNGAMLLAFGMTDSDALSEDWLDNSPLFIETQHCADGDDASGNLLNSVIYSESGLSAGSVAGRSLDHVGDNSGFRSIVGMIIEPA